MKPARLPVESGDTGTKSTIPAIGLMLVIALMATAPPTIIEGLPSLRVLRIALIVVVLATFLLTAKPRLSLPRTLGPLSLIMFGSYQLLSSLWSPSTWDGAAQGASFLLMVIAAMTAARKFQADRMRRIVIVSLGSILAVGAAVSIFIPTIGQEASTALAGSWRGLAVQKNLFASLGAILAIFLFAGLGERPTDRPPRRHRLLLHMCGFICAVSLVLLAGSRGGLLLLGVGTFTILGFRSSRHRSLRIWLVGLMVLFGALIVLASSSVDDQSLSVSGYELNSSSRFAIWSFGLNALSEVPVFGFGLDGFWTPLRIDVFLQEHGWALPNLHNGYLSIVVEGGIVGLGLLLLALISLVARLVGDYLRGDDDTALPLALAATLIVSNLFENHLGQSLNPLTFIPLLFMFGTHQPSGKTARGTLPRA